MRSFDVVVGMLVVTTGLVGFPGMSEVANVLDPAGATAEVRFHELGFEGDARVVSQGGALVVDGPGFSTIHAPTAEVTVNEYTFVEADLTDPLRITTLSTGWKEEYVRNYDNVTITIEGTAEGLLQAWPGSEENPTTFDLSMRSLPGSSIHASRTGTHVISPEGDYSHLVEAPTFGFSHEGAEIDRLMLHQMTLGAARFEALTADGALVVVVQEALVKVEHAAGRETLVAGTERPLDASVPLADAGKMTYIAFRVSDGRLDSTFSGTRAAFMSSAPHLDLTGVSILENATGHVASDHVTELDDAALILDGNTSIELLTYGEADGTSRTGPLVTGSMAPVPEPESQAVVQKHNGEIRIDGQTLATANAAEPAPFVDQVTWLARLVGALLVVWAAIRWGTVLVAGMVAKKPLANPRRQELFDLLRAQGLAHVRDLHRATGIPLGTLVYHLGILRQAKLVRSIQTAGYRVYFVPSVAFCHDEMRRLVLLAEPTRRGICQALHGQAPLSQVGLAKRLSLSHSQVAKQLKALVAQELVERRGSRNARYVLTDLTSRWFAAEPAPVPVTMPVCGSGQPSDTKPARAHGIGHD